MAAARAGRSRLAQQSPDWVAKTRIRWCGPGMSPLQFRVVDGGRVVLAIAPPSRVGVLPVRELPDRAMDRHGSTQRLEISWNSDVLR